MVTEPFAAQMFGSPEAAIDQTFQLSGIPFTVDRHIQRERRHVRQSEVADQTILIPYSVGTLLHRHRQGEADLFFDSGQERRGDAAKQIRGSSSPAQAELGVHSDDPDCAAWNGGQHRQCADVCCCWSRR